MDLDARAFCGGKIMKEGKPSICYESDLDEAFIVGTKEELYEFAQSILKLIDGPKKSFDYFGIKTQQVDTVESLTESMSEIVIDTLLIVEKKEDRRKLVNEVRINNGELPIDWEGYDNLP